MEPLFVIITVTSALLVLAILGMMYVVYRQLRELHLTMNSRLDELIAVTKALARAEGFKAGQETHLKEIRDFEIGKADG